MRDCTTASVVSGVQIAVSGRPPVTRVPSPAPGACFDLPGSPLLAGLESGSLRIKLCQWVSTVVGDLWLHPLKRMLDLGLLVTVNSDDPACAGA